MHLKNIFLQNVFAFALVCSCSFHLDDWLKYADFSKIHESCRLQLCYDETGQERQNPSCHCDDTCSRYGTCCLDSSYATLSFMMSFRRRENCSKVPGRLWGVFMISTCDPRYTNHQVIRKRCESIGFREEDPLSTIPVSNPVSTMTYKNYFCSLCNFDHHGVVFWDVELSFSDERLRHITPEDRQTILRRLDYSANRNKWGIWKTRYNGTVEFIPGTIAVHTPEALKSMVKRCDMDLESRCAPTWTNADVERICQSYISPIRMARGDENIQFRNPHCAICNYLTKFEEALCFRTLAGYPRLSFTLLLDVNPSDGDKVGEKNSCSENEVFDPFFRKCRALVCALPGYVIRDGKCVKA